VRIAIIGLGSIGRRHLRNLWTLGERDIQAYDNEHRGFSTGADTPLWEHASAASLWASKPDVALICTPSEYHIQHANDALDAGVKALFIEKPLSYSMDGVVELQARASAQRVITMVACQWRWRPGVEELLKQPGLLAFRADVPIAAGRRTTLHWDVDWHFVDLALWNGSSDYVIVSSYNDPYDVEMRHGGMQMRWIGDYDANKDYVAEMGHFLRCAREHIPTGNDIAQARATLEILLEREG